MTTNAASKNARGAPAAGKAETPHCKRCAAIVRLSPLTLVDLGIAAFDGDGIVTRCGVCGKNWFNLDEWTGSTDAELERDSEESRRRLLERLARMPKEAAAAFAEFLPADLVRDASRSPPRPRIM